MAVGRDRRVRLPCMPRRPTPAPRIAAGVLAVALAIVVVLAFALALATHGEYWRVPDRHNPWAPLRIDETPGWLTRFKLERLDRDDAACRAVLATSMLRWEAVPDRETAPGCGFRNAVIVERMQTEVSSPFSISCRAAVSLALWEQHVLRPEAQRHLAAPVRRIDHFGSYACRNVYGRAGARRSQHATADALDISGFVVGRRRISVARHWHGDDASAGFLRAVHLGACGFFDGALGPGYNAAHADHFHFDRGPYRVCR